MPQSGPGGPRNGSESPPPTWQPRGPQYQPPHQPGRYQPPHYEAPYDQQYPPPPYEQGNGFRNPRTGSDYRLGDDYTMPMSHDTYTAPAPPDPYASDPYNEGLLAPGDTGQLPPGPGGRDTGRPRKRGRIRRFFRRPAVRVLAGLLLIGLCWVSFSLGQALTADNGLPLSAKLAEWARDHYLGSIVTLMEQATYTPPPAGGKPTFSLTGPPSKTKFKHVRGFKPDIPKNLTPFARPALAGEGVWRVQELVRGQPALFTTYMRVDAVHTSFVAGIASFDQRLVKFQLRPGTTDPGAGFGGGQSWITPRTRTGLLATFNGGFRLNSSRGGFYLNGRTSGTLTGGAASVVYFCNGTIKIGEWGRDVQMTKNVCGVRQNLRLIVDHGRVAANINSDVEANFGATLGGAYDVWRSGIGQTKDGRIIYVYGPALSAASLANLLDRAGAVEGMELDINPTWTTFEYYQARGHASDPTPVAMLPEQPSLADRYYSVWSRDFTAVYAR